MQSHFIIVICLQETTIQTLKHVEQELQEKETALSIALEAQIAKCGSLSSSLAQSMARLAELEEEKCTVQALADETIAAKANLETELQQLRLSNDEVCLPGLFLILQHPYVSPLLLSRLKKDSSKQKSAWLTSSEIVSDNCRQSKAKCKSTCTKFQSATMSQWHR